MGACASRDASAPTRTIEVISRTASTASSASTVDGADAGTAGEDDAATTARGARDGDARGEVAVVADAPEVEATAGGEEERASEGEEEAAREEEAATIEALRRALEATLPASSTPAKTGAGWSSVTMKERAVSRWGGVDVVRVGVEESARDEGVERGRGRVQQERRGGIDADGAAAGG